MLSSSDGSKRLLLKSTAFTPAVANVELSLVIAFGPRLQLATIKPDNVFDFDIAAHNASKPAKFASSSWIGDVCLPAPLPSEYA